MTSTITATTTTTVTAVRRAAHLALAVSAALLLAAAAPATAGSGAGGDHLYLLVTTGDGRSSDTRGTLLLCDPPQGHARAAEACAQLDSVGGDIDALPAADVVCPMLYAPVTVRADGQWNGRPVEYRQTFSNGCVMGARTGAVFALDD
ncbi:SSI family serine proteinase inhibitor [Streptomyces pseudovenezuelae]|uniref:SSI family serine proteinase inhibitor n=1 Tax=Streptomyces pseudovenezuelae TaxID=67350 RepID=UPI002E8125F7|nr:SSI family serine proteinase inhibitor [Streptomyces pseudovenezuelae]WUA87767.1 subtilase-type protease inhibitor [Streptomyces pseudovenezuelae]